MLTLPAQDLKAHLIHSHCYKIYTLPFCEMHTKDECTPTHPDHWDFEAMSLDHIEALHIDDHREFPGGGGVVPHRHDE